MSTRLDIIAAKLAFERHVGEHRCIAVQEAIARGVTPCPYRVPLWQAYVGPFSTAHRWGTEIGDPARVTEQFSHQIVG
jgi:hypothetical protein